MLVTRRGRPADPASPSRVGDIPRRVRPDPPCRKRVRAGQVPRAQESTLHAERDPPRSKSRNPGKVIFPMDEAFLVPEKALRTGSSGLSDFSALSVPAPSPTSTSRICHRWRGSCRSASGYRIDEASHHATHPPSRPARGTTHGYSIDEASQSLRTYRHSLRGSLRGIIASMKLLPHLKLAAAASTGDYAWYSIDEASHSHTLIGAARAGLSLPQIHAVTRRRGRHSAHRPTPCGLSLRL